MRDYRTRVAELETQVRSKAKSAQLESRISVLQEQLETESREKTTLSKQLRRSENKIRDIEGQLADERLNSQLLREQAEQSTTRLKTLKKQMADTDDELSRSNMARRKLQLELDEQTETAESLQLEVTKLRSAGRY